jgi:hypothetical protein
MVLGVATMNSSRRGIDAAGLGGAAADGQLLAPLLSGNSLAAAENGPDPPTNSAPIIIRFFRVVIDSSAAA